MVLVVGGCFGANGERAGERAATAGDGVRVEDAAAGAENHGLYDTATAGAQDDRGGAAAAVGAAGDRMDEVAAPDAADTNADRAAAAGARSDAQAAADVLRRYYAAIQAQRYADAYRLWSGDGQASGQTIDDFAVGFASTRSVDVEIGTPGRIEGAAGSRYVAIPVVIRADNAATGPQRFEGSYVLRRSVVDGASAAQRAWRISSADLVERSGSQGRGEGSSDAGDGGSAR